MAIGPSNDYYVSKLVDELEREFDSMIANCLVEDNITITRMRQIGQREFELVKPRVEQLYRDAGWAQATLYHADSDIRLRLDKI